MTTSDGRGFGRRLKALRLEKGLSQQALGGDRYTAAYISHLEAGKRRPSPKALPFLAKRLGVTEHQLLTGQPPDLEPNLELRLQQARLSIDQGAFEQAEDAVDEVAEAASRHRLHRLEAKTHEMRGLLAERKGSEQQALEHFEAAERMWQQEPAHLRYEAIAGIARCHQSLGDVRYAIHVLESYLLELNREGLKDPVALMRTYSGLIGAYFGAGLMEKAIEAAEEAQRFAPRVKQAQEVACMNMNVARALLYQGRPKDAMDALRRAEELFAGLGWRRELAKAHIAQGIVAAEKRDYDQARASLQTALDLVETVQSPDDHVIALQELGRVERLAGDVKKAQRVLLDAMPFLGEAELLTKGMTYRELGLTYAESDPQKAQEHLLKAVDLYRQARARSEVATTLKELACIYRALGDVGTSLRAYEEAFDAIEERM